jgi:hypothetical protein
MKNTCKILVGNPKGKRPLEDIGVNAFVILKWLLISFWKCGLDSTASRQIPVTDTYEHGNKLSASINVEESNDWLSDY